MRVISMLWDCVCHQYVWDYGELDQIGLGVLELRQMGVLILGGLCWVGWQTGGWMMGGWAGGGLVMGWRTSYSVMFASGVPLFSGFPGDRFGEVESLLEVWCLYLNAETLTPLSLSYLRASPLCIDMLLGMPIGVALRPDVSPSTCLGENLSKNIYPGRVALQKSQPRSCQEVRGYQWCSDSVRDFKIKAWQSQLKQRHRRVTTAR